MFKIENYRGHGWTGFWLVTDTLLTEEQRDLFISQLRDMYLDKQKRRRVKGDGFEGLAKKIGHFTLHGLGGYQYDVELDIQGRNEKAKLSYIVTKRINENLN